MFKIKTLHYYGFYDINIDLFNLDDVVNYNYAYILLGLLGHLNSLKGNIQRCLLKTRRRLKFR